MQILSGLSAAAARYEVIFCDVWGVIHNGRRHFEGACAALSRFRAQGGSVILVTNAPRPNPPVRDQLDGLGVPRSAFDDIVTSGDVTLARIAERGDTPLHHIGPPRDLSLFDVLRQLKGFRPPLVALDLAQYVVCTGLFDDRNDKLADYDAALASMRARNLDLISANPDIVVHVGDAEIYCSGAIAERYSKLGGRVIQAGKPFAPIYEEAMKLAGARLGKPVNPARVLAIGDGLRTDVKGACDSGLDCLFITSGVHRADLHANGALDEEAMTRVLRGAGVAPAYAMPDLAW